MVMMADTDLGDIAEKVRAGRRLSYDDGLRLYATRDLFTLGELANLVRERLHGRRTYYNVNRHINYSNYCVLRCKFCSFYRPYPKEPRASARAEPPAEQGRPLAALPLAPTSAESNRADEGRAGAV
ncbi:MAG: hypothetical protein HRF43_01975 [Phycisphaerae bacterium]|jgi:2-iminoacetate synthase ThiH